MTDLSLLQHFVAVAEAGSFVRASERLHVSQSSISRSISRLEDELGVILIERTTRKLSLTAAGQALFSGARANLDRLAVAWDDARRVGLGAQAKLRVGICPTVATDTLTIVRGMQAFQKGWPQIELIVSSVISVHQPAALRTSAIDIGFMQLDKADCQDLQWQLLSRTALKVAVPTSWGVKSNRLCLEDLGDWAWLVPDPERASIAYERVLGFFRSAGIDPRVTGFVSDSFTAQIMLACGLGATLVHSDAARGDLDGYDLVALDVGGHANYVETVASWAVGSTAKQVVGLISCLTKDLV